MCGCVMVPEGAPHMSHDPPLACTNVQLLFQPCSDLQMDGVGTSGTVADGGEKGAFLDVCLGMGACVFLGIVEVSVPRDAVEQRK